ncbi:MAG: YddF family protein [Candidatus Omnitrophica bacterium]|nr:YddF family protein [Candidatus Omnitrophota bacterium]
MLEDKGMYVNYKLLNLKQVKKLLKNNPFLSAIGHEGTAKFLSSLLGLQIKPNRIKVKLQKISDYLIVFSLNERLPEGKILTKEEIEKIKNYKFFLFFLGDGRSDPEQDHLDVEKALNL